MGQPTTVQNGQRLDKIEQELASLKNSMAEEIGAVVSKSSAEMQQNITNQIAASLEQISQRLEGRIQRSRETQKALFAKICDEQVRFQTEIRSTIIDRRLPHTPPSEMIGVIKGWEAEGEGSTSHVGHRIGLETGIGGDPGGGTGVGIGMAVGGGGNWKYRKLDMPLFDGQDPDGWILRVERYFSFYRLNEEEKMEAAVVGMEGEALSWYQWEHRRRPIRIWVELKELLLKQFRPVNSGSLYEQWLAVSQSGSVEEYRRQFIKLAAPLENVPEQILMGQFINGLKDEVKAEVRLLNPVNLDWAMDLAVRVEEKNRAGGNKGNGVRSTSLNTTKYTPNPSVSKSPYTLSTASNYSQPVSSPTKSWSSNASGHLSNSNSQYSSFPIARPMGEIRRLTERELQQKKQKGICFRCDDKWSIGHRCKKRELSVLLTQDEECEDVIETIGVENAEQQVDDKVAKVSLNSVVGLTSPKTMKLIGKIGDQEVIVMVDPGATHNFISLDAVERLGLPVIQSKEFGVSLGNGEAVRGSGECKGVQVKFEGVEIWEDFFHSNLVILM